MNGLLERWTGLTLLEPWFLAVLAALPVALLFRRRAPSVDFGPASLDGGAPLPATLRTRLVGVPSVLAAAALVLLAVALARPVRRVEVPSQREGIDILLALDVSSSMTAADLDGRRTRLDVAKSAAAEFVKSRGGDRVGLIAFARYADVVCPPTLDHDALLDLLARVRTVESDGPEDATGIGTAVARAAFALRGGPSRSKVVVLLTDGEETVATSAAPREIAPMHAAQLCAELGVRVYAIAAGAAPSAGRAAVDTGPVERVAARTGGRFFAAGDAASVTEVYAAIDALERARIEEPRYETEERFVPFVLAAIVCAVLARLAGETVLRVLP